MDDQLLVHCMDDVLMWHAAKASAPGGTIQTAKLCSKHMKREHKLTCLKLRSVTTVGAIASDCITGQCHTRSNRQGRAIQATGAHRYFTEAVCDKLLNEAKDVLAEADGRLVGLQRTDEAVSLSL